MKKLLYLFTLIAIASTFWACKETSEQAFDDHYDWKARNEQFFKDTLNYAKRQIAAAQAAHGADWEKHCPWRLYPTYLAAPGSKTTWEDSLVVRVMDIVDADHDGISDNASYGSPFYTDSVRVVYAGRLIPSDSYKDGYMFDHTGLSNSLSDIMDPHYGTVATFKVSNVVEGWTTALQNMLCGDYWRIYIPAHMGYGVNGTTNIPAHSTLVFDVRLKAFYRAGVVPEPWL